DVRAGEAQVVRLAGAAGVPEEQRLRGVRRQRRPGVPRAADAHADAPRAEGEEGEVPLGLAGLAAVRRHLVEPALAHLARDALVAVAGEVAPLDRVERRDAA